MQAQANKQYEVIDPPCIAIGETQPFSPPACTEDIIEPIVYVEPHIIQKCGDVGKGPRPPDSPLIGIEGVKDIPSIMDEIESGETEGRTLMTFAKMQVPQALRESYLLSNSDFELHANEAVENKEELKETSTSVEEIKEAITTEEAGGKLTVTVVEVPVVVAPFKDLMSPSAKKPSGRIEAASPMSRGRSQQTPTTAGSKKNLKDYPLREMAAQNGLY